MRPVLEPGTVVIVTGAARRVGRGVVEAVLEAGGTAVGLDGDPEGLAVLSARGAGAPGRLETHALDLTDRRQVRQVFDGVAARYGRIDALVNVAGAIRGEPVTDLAEADWEALIRPDIRGIYQCTVAAVPHMLRRRRGKVINVGGPRAAGRDRVIAFTRRLGRELASQGICINAIVPAGRGSAPASPGAAVSTILFLVSPAGDGYRGETLRPGEEVA